jgi:hypothetical protein
MAEEEYTLPEVTDLKNPLLGQTLVHLQLLQEFRSFTPSNGVMSLKLFEAGREGDCDRSDYQKTCPASWLVILFIKNYETAAEEPHLFMTQQFINPLEDVKFIESKDGKSNLETSDIFSFEARAYKLISAPGEKMKLEQWKYQFRIEKGICTVVPKMEAIRG